MSNGTHVHTLSQEIMRKVFAQYENRKEVEKDRPMFPEMVKPCRKGESLLAKRIKASLTQDERNHQWKEELVYQQYRITGEEISQFSQFEKLEDLRKAVTREVRCQVNAARYREAVEFKFPKPNSYEPEPEKKAAVMAWGFKHDIGESKDPLIDNVMNSLARTGYWIEYVPGNLDPKRDAACPGRVRSNNPVGWSKANGIQLVVLFVARCNEALLELMGDLVIAGIEVVLAGIEGFKIKPVPCTRRYFPDPAKKWNPEIYKIIENPRRDDSMDKWDMGIPGPLATLAGKWVELKKGVFRWQEPKWTYDELAQMELPFGSIIMWKPEDYKGMEEHIASKWMPPIASTWEPGKGKGTPIRASRWSIAGYHCPDITGEKIYCPLVAPEGIEYPHDLDLTGFKFCEIPARRFDYLVGQSWIYGEFAQKIRAYHAHPVIQAELACFEDRTYDSGLKSDGSGYWDDEKGKHSEQVPYIYTGCQGGKPIKECPVWLTPRDRFGKPIGTQAKKPRAKFNQHVRDTYANGLERHGYEDIEDPMPANWEQGVPWAFDDYNGSFNMDDTEESDSLEGEEGTHYYILDEATDFYRKPVREEWIILGDVQNRRDVLFIPNPKNEAKWIYNADIHVAKLIEKAKEKAITAGQKARASSNRERVRVAKESYRRACKEQPWQRKQAEAKAERHAWYLAVELLGRMERLREKAGMKPPDDAKNYVGEMFRKLENISLEITPLLLERLTLKRKGIEKLHIVNRQEAERKGWRIGSPFEDGRVQAYEKCRDAEMSMHQTLQEEYRQTRNVLKAMSAELRKSPETRQLSEVLHEHPEQLVNALMRDWGLTIWTLRENRDIPLAEDLLKEMKRYHKEQVKRFPELWTKRGTRRKHPVHEKIS